MYKFAVLLVILVTYTLKSEAGVYGRSGDRTGSLTGSYVGRRNSYLAGVAGNSITTTEKPNSPRDLSKQGLSAWGLIMIIIGIIVLAFSAYYGIICYPFLCKTEKNYQFMDVSSTMTAATYRSIQSLENLQIYSRDQKH